MTYYDRDGMLDPDEREAREAIANVQMDRILTFFEKYPLAEYTPFEVQRLALPECPITSVRRAMTDLTSAGWLVKTGNKVIEVYGQPNRTWRLNCDRSVSFGERKQQTMF